MFEQLDRMQNFLLFFDSLIIAFVLIAQRCQKLNVLIAIGPYIIVNITNSTLTRKKVKESKK